MHARSPAAFALTRATHRAPAPAPPTMTSSADCPFCDIAAHTPASATPAAASGAHVVLATPAVLAFLDILPLAPAHLLVVPRAHAATLDGLAPAAGAALGAWLPVLARAVARVSGCEDFNVVQNNGAGAAQVVPHVHFHIIPRPDERMREALEAAVPDEHKRLFRSKFGIGWRNELDDDEGRVIAERLRAEVAKEVEAAADADKMVLGKL